jgi:hypothetical protein
MWRWLARIATTLAAGSFIGVMAFLVGIAVVGVLAFIWIVLWGG